MLRAHRLLLIALALLLGACASPANKNVQITQTARGVEIRSSDKILFDSGKADIKPEGSAFLDRVASILKTRTRKPVSIEGHTDNVGSDAYNQRLSVRRAEAVKAYLVGKGIEANRVYTEGKGEKQPVADNRTADGRAKNRRVEIEVVGTRARR